MVPQGYGGLAEINKKILPCVGATSITSSRGVLSKSDAVEVVIAYMYITIFVQGRLIQLSTSNNIISTPQLYVSMLMHWGGGGGGRGVAYIWRGDLIIQKCYYIIIFSQRPLD